MSEFVWGKVASKARERGETGVHQEWNKDEWSMPAARVTFYTLARRKTKFESRQKDVAQ